MLWEPTLGMLVSQTSSTASHDQPRVCSHGNRKTRWHSFSSADGRTRGRAGAPSVAPQRQISSLRSLLVSGNAS